MDNKQDIKITKSNEELICILCHHQIHKNENHICTHRIQQPNLHVSFIN